MYQKHHYSSIDDIATSSVAYGTVDSDVTTTSNISYGTVDSDVVTTSNISYDSDVALVPVLEISTHSRETDDGMQALDYEIPIASMPTSQ